MTDIEKLIKAVDGSIDEFELALPFIEKDIANKVEILISKLDTRQGKIRPTVKNLRALKELRKEIQKILNSGKYNLAFENLEKSLVTITDANENYFSKMVEDFTAPEVLKEVKSVTLLEMSESLKGSGINSNVIDGMLDIIKNDIYGSANFYDLNKSLREFIISEPDIPSRLARWSKQVVTDTMHQYSRTYQQIVTDDLGLEWFEYIGGLVKDSRCFCDEMVAKHFIHKSEFETVLSGRINGKKCQLNKDTGLPQGLKMGTNKDNLQVLCGGWNCRHEMPSVSKERVPKDIRAKFEKTST
jgi:hypothetical protein